MHKGQWNVWHTIIYQSLKPLIAYVYLRYLVGKKEVTWSWSSPIPLCRPQRTDHVNTFLSVILLWSFITFIEQRIWLLLDHCIHCIAANHDTTILLMMPSLNCRIDFIHKLYKNVYVIMFSFKLSVGWWQGSQCYLSHKKIHVTSLPT